MAHEAGRLYLMVYSEDLGV